MSHVSSGPVFLSLWPQVQETVLPFRVLGGFKYEKKKMGNLGGFLSISLYSSNNFTVYILGNSYLSPKGSGRICLYCEFYHFQKAITFFDLFMLLLLDFAWASFGIVIHAFFFICIHLVCLHTYLLPLENYFFKCMSQKWHMFQLFYPILQSYE